MPTELEIRLAEFVDRDTEMSRFCGMLDSGTRSIMFVSGGGGYGKSSLLARMIHECALRDLRKSEITWSETQNHDYLGIMRRIRDDIGVEYFQNFTTVVNQFTDPSIRITVAANLSNIEVAHGLQMEGSTVGDVGGIIVKDNMFVVPKGDRSIPESERMIPLTVAFLQNLAAAALKIGPIAVFFDAVEKMTRETSAWVVGELFHAVQTGTLRNIFFVHCGREKPIVDRFVDSIAEEAELGPLKAEDIVLYLQKRGMKEANLDYAELLLVATKGNPLQIATLIDAVMKQRQKRT
jgi:hypothetical protein